MENEITFDEFKNEVYEDAKKNVDEVIKLKNIKFEDLNTVKVNKISYNLNKKALKDILNTLSIQKKTLDMFGTDFQVKMITERMKDIGNKDVFCRFKEGNMRAVFSEKYYRFDNKDFIDTFTTKIGELLSEDKFSIKDYHIGDDIMRLNLLDRNTHINVGSLNDSRLDDFNRGFSIVNSETGYFSFSINSYLYRLICTNGLVSSDALFSYKFRHKRNMNEISNRFNTRVNELVDNSNRIFNKLNEMKNFIIDVPNDDFFDNFFKNLRKNNKQFYANKDLKEVIKKNYSIESNLTGDNYYTLLNAFTRTARDMNDEKRYDFEIICGSLIN